MKKLIAVLLVVGLSFALFACTNSSGNSIRVTWENTTPGEETQSMTAGLLTDIIQPLYKQNKIQIADIQTSGTRYTNTPTPLSAKVTKIRAELYEDGSKVNNAEFDFVFEGPEKNIKNQSNDYVYVTFQKSGSGTVTVKHDDMTKKVQFEVKAAGAVENIENFGYKNKGYDFEQEKDVPKTESMIYIAEKREVISNYPYAKIPRSGFWDEYNNITDVTGLDYKYGPGQMWPPDVNSSDPKNYNYAFKLPNGYAKMMITNYQYRSDGDGSAWGFVFDYSPDGTF